MKVLAIRGCFLAITLLTSCSKPEPLLLGFVGGLSGRVADLGIAGRNGAMLAIEQKNAAGGINGRTIKLVVKNDEQSPETAKKVTAELIGQRVEAIIGPMTSSIAMAMMPLVNASGTVLISPTATTTELAGKDDNFIRVISTTTDYASKSAHYQYEKLGRRTVAVIYDKNNSSYTESWLYDFQRTFTGLGGRIKLVRTFSSGENAVFLGAVKELLTVKPDLVLIISNAFDAAMICQQIRKIDSRIPVVMSEWGSTEHFVELAGVAAEGVHVAQFLDRSDTSSRYEAFLGAYRKRFAHDPGFAGIAGYDAALVAIESMAKRRPGQSLKEAILAIGSFHCVQQIINIDRFGEANRKTFITYVKNGKYMTLE
jgi:branched-chain amino acid transport system substrate-binding protein